MASKLEIRAIFESQHEHLFWMALLITDNAATAQNAIINATELSTTNAHSVFHDWLTQWAKSATIRSAAVLVRDQIRQSAEEHKGEHCEHADHAPLSKAEAGSIYEIDRKFIGTLDPLARTVFVFRGIQHASIQDCVIALGVSRNDVIAAYCRALAWFHAHSPQIENFDSQGDSVRKTSDYD